MLTVLDQDNHDFERRLQSEAPSSLDAAGNISVILLSEQGPFPGGQREIQNLLQIFWDVYLEDVALLSSPLLSSYHGRCIEINESPFLGHTLYILPKSKPDLRDLIQAIGDRFERSSQDLLSAEKLDIGEKSQPLHPLTLHSVVMLYVLSSRNTELNNLVKWLLWIETQLHQGSIFEVTGSDRFSRYIQLLHNMSRKLITLEHNNQRDASNIGHLLRDHERLGRLADLHGTYLDRTTHQRVCDDLLMLHDLCDDRHRRILNLQRRTSNFVTLLYHLITGHDSTINLQIATESAKIARDARKDSMSMKIIAGMTMLYLPATFVCSLFGTNLIVLDTPNDQSEPVFMVSRLWWLYPAFAVPLTVFTMAGFILWRRFREQKPRKGRED
ncbi:hypothetical protein N7541_007862 [Penicillium brevicompactum]|uniref:Uncharacterized protein n=1 Tax=Penicillium brevicompactum TaxID=5074 RepID=A0A9W9QY77_PENBR|nr:hypothetical protein N7541_007862 [Penicillium brevicompactum]